MHVGGMSRLSHGYDVDSASDRLLEALRGLDTDGVELLLENLPPYPWYFGGRWFSFVLCDAENTVRLCEASGLGLCFDTSHAALECSRSGANLADFARRLAPYVRHLHESDGAGTSGEGLPIGDGEVNFVELLPPLLAEQPTLIPEIWMGHHETGEGFARALHHLSDLHWAHQVLVRPTPTDAQALLASLEVSADATVFSALRVIDANRMGIAFVLAPDRRVVGVVTDGDLRHAFVRGLGLHAPVGEVMTRSFRHGTAGMTKDQLRERLAGRTRVLPMLDAAGRLVDFASQATVG